MTVSDVLRSNMINDNTVICIDKQMEFGGSRLFKGHWYEDRCLEFGDYEVNMLTYDRENNIVMMEVES